MGTRMIALKRIDHDGVSYEDGAELVVEGYQAVSALLVQSAELAEGEVMPEAPAEPDAPAPEPEQEPEAPAEPEAEPEAATRRTKAK